MARKRKPSGRGTGNLKRKINFREPAQRFLIVCEGQRTEPAYFDGFRAPGIIIRIEGLGIDPLSLVREAANRLHEDDFDQVWCVFDRDDVPADRFNQALALARQLKIEVACSNQAFELWYLLHFNYLDAALTRGDYMVRLDQSLGRPYQKNDDGLYTQLLPRQPQAIQNAERLLGQYNPRDPAVDDPSTTVHKLVQELNRFTQETRFA